MCASQQFTDQTEISKPRTHLAREEEGEAGLVIGEQAVAHDGLRSGSGGGDAHGDPGSAEASPEPIAGAEERRGGESEGGGAHGGGEREGAQDKRAAIGKRKKRVSECWHTMLKCAGGGCWVWVSGVN